MKPLSSSRLPTISRSRLSSPLSPARSRIVAKAAASSRFSASAGAGDHGAPRIGHQRLLHLLVEHLEMAGDVGLQRELVEDRLAESVDGLDLQPARRLQRLGEQPARPPQLVGAGPCAFQPLDLLGQPVVVERRPAGEVLIDALGHVGGGGPRIGQAQDLRRIGAAQQQPDDAARQHMRLAGAGIGRHPHRMPGIGGNRLPPRRLIGDRVRMLHSASPGSSSPPADHSSTRAR